MALTKVSNSMQSSAPVSVIDYGADPTGNLDSTTAIQAAIDSTNATNGVLFPAGTYLITSTLDLTNKTGINFYGTGMRVTTLNFSNISSHGFDMTGADTCSVSEIAINATGGSPKAGILLARELSGSAGGFCKFSRVRLVGWDVGIYSYGSELNYYEGVVSANKVALFSNAANPLSYTSSFVTIATGGQSNTYLTWMHGQLESVAALDATYDAALVLEDVNSCNFYNPILMSRGANLGSNVQIRSFAKNVAFFGGRLESIGAIGFKIDGLGVNRLTLQNIDVAPVYPDAFALVGKGTTGSVSGLTILGCGMVGANVANLVNLDILTGALLDSTNTNVKVATRFGGVVVEGNPTTWTLPADREGVVVQSQGRTWLFDRTQLGGPLLTDKGTLEGIAGLSGSADNTRSYNLRGSATFATSSTVAVAFTTNEVDAVYKLSISGNANETFWITSKATTGFTINSGNGSSTATVDWVLIR
jgi:hypothetical protein